MPFRVSNRGPVMMGRTALAIAAWLCLAGQAQATGTLHCSIADRSLTVTFQAIVSHGLGEGLVSVQGQVIPGEALAAAGHGPFPLDRETVAQYWHRGGALKLRLYRETPTPPLLSLDLIIEATREKRDARAYAGRYEAEAFRIDDVTGPEGKIIKAKGRVDCQSG